MTYAELDEQSDRMAGTLRASGLAPQDKIAVMLPNIAEFLISYFAILKAGLTMVPLNPLLKSGELAFHLDDSDTRVFVVHDALAEQAVLALQSHPEIRTVVVGSKSIEGWPPGTVEFATMIDDDHGYGDDIVPTNADDTAVLLYTSGTTGRAKGAELSHFQLYMNCSIAGRVFEVRDDDVSLAVLPFFHVFGLSSVVNVAVYHGGTMSVVPRFDVQAVVDAIERDRISVFVGVPTMFWAMLAADTTGRDLSSLRVACSGGAAIAGPVLEAFEQRFGIAVLEGYGLSESASTTTMNPSPDDRRVLSIGKPIWGVQTRIVDEFDQSVPAGAEHVGEIVIRGHNITQGYYKRPDETAEAFRGGWFHTGDLGYADSDGFLYIVDRKKDLVIRGGFNVYPREVEELLYTHPAIAEAAVIGRPDERLGEEVVAVVSLKQGHAATADEIREFARSALAGYKYPRDVYIVAELPKGATGKILKRDLRQRFSG